MNDDFFHFLIVAALSLILGVLIGLAICGDILDKSFDGQFEKIKYEYKLNKEKQNDTTKN